MASKRPTYPVKTNDPGASDATRKFFATEANENREIFQDHADSIDLLLAALGINEGVSSIGEFISLVVLQAAYPSGADGSYAVINDGLGTTPQVATYNGTSGLWETPTPDDPIIWVANAAALPGTGVANKLYVALDSGTLYYWNAGQYKTAGGTTAAPKIVYIANNNTNWRVFKGEGNVGAGLELGDEVNHRIVADKRLVVGFILDTNITLPADFEDANKFERYIDTNAML